MARSARKRDKTWTKGPNFLKFRCPKWENNGASNWFALLIGKLTIFSGFCPLCNGTYHEMIDAIYRFVWVDPLLLDSLLQFCTCKMIIEEIVFEVVALESVAKYKSVIVHSSMIWGQEKGWALVSVNISM